MAKLRISDHNLMIETGRYQGLRKEERFCPFCKNSVENETHFLLNCPTYESIRSSVLNNQGKQQFRTILGGGKTLISPK